MQNDIAELKGDVSAIRKDISILQQITASNWSDIIEMKKAN
ncbi:MAG: hypothetical protein N4A50_02055 [Vallitalea sp.]|jgi:hypothetical protein|nr:hypothetical protein [Vallitalea sp.]